MASMNRTAECVIKLNDKLDDAVTRHVEAGSTIQSIGSYVMLRIYGIGLSLAEESLTHKISSSGIETDSFFTVDQAREILQVNGE